VPEVGRAVPRYRLWVEDAAWVAPEVRKGIPGSMRSDRDGGVWLVEVVAQEREVT
jgi:hypothetical protein